MAIIYSYPITTPQDSDLFIISRVPDDPDEISNFSVGVGTIAEYVIDKLIDPNAFDFQIPVFNQSGNRITGSIMSQDSSPSNGIAGTKITIAGNTTTTGDVQIDTLTNNYIPFNNAAGILRDSVIYQDGDGHVGIGVPGSPPNPVHKFEVYDDRSENISSDYTQVNSTVVGPPWTGGGGGILSRLSIDAGSTFPYGISLIPGTIASDIASSGKMAFHANSDLDTRAPSGFSGFISHDGANPHWQIGGAVTDPNPTQTLKVVGTGEFTGQVTIPLTPIANTDAASKGYVDSQLDKDLQIQGDTGTGSINLDTQVFDVAGGTYIDTTAGGQTITVDISAVDGNPGINERYLTKNNTWAEVATIPGTYRFNVNADTGNAQTVNTTETLLLAGGTYMNTSVGIGPEVTFNHDNTTLTTTSSSLSPGVGGSFSVIDSITTNLQGHVTDINTLTVTLPQDTDNYVDGGSYSNSTGTLSLTRTGGLADVDVSGFLEEAPSDGSQYARQNGSWSVVSGGGGGTVTGTGTTHTLPVWEDGPNGVLSDSAISEVRGGSGDPVSSVIINTTEGIGPLKVNFGSGGTTSFFTGSNEFIRLSNSLGGFYRYASRLTVDRNAASNNPSLDVGDSDHGYPAAWFRNGVVISNNPSGVQVDNTSMVIGAGNNDNVSGSDQTGSTDATAAGNQNTITTSSRSLALGSQNQITNATSSFAAGGENVIPSGTTNMLLGYQNTAVSGGSNYILGNVITGTSQAMTIGFRNNTAGYPTPNKNLGLGDTKFIVAVGSNTTTNANALLITEGGINGGSSGTVPQVPRVLLPTVTGFSASNDAAADALGVPQGALYQNQGVVQINRGGGSTTDPLAGGGGGNYTVSVINSNTVGQKNYLYVLTGGSTITLTMPSSPSPGDSIKVVNLTTVTTCVIAQGGSPIMGSATDMTLDNNKANFELVYTDITRGWVIIGATGEI
jgi:hypothetical protein